MTARPVYRFDLTEWFPERGKREFTWDCDTYALFVLPDGSIEKHTRVCDDDDREIAAMHPASVYLGRLSRKLSLPRGPWVLESSQASRALAEKHPEVHRLLAERLGEWE